MIWSVLPVFFPDGTATGAGDAAQVVACCGRSVLVRGGRITRLLSTDPADFLDERFRPGTALPPGHGPS